MTRPRACHLLTGDVTLCGTWAPHLVVSEAGHLVTCKRCVYFMLDRGELVDSDPRVTDSMRRYRFERGLDVDAQS